MNEIPEKAPKKVKEKKQTQEERLEAMRYNHMMYGKTENELKHVPRRVDYGVPYLKHQKFQDLMKAFKNGNSFNFDVSANGKTYVIATDGSHITFDSKIIYYSRPLNKHEDNLLLNRAQAIQFQSTEAVVHLVFAVLRSLPELGDHQLSFLGRKFYVGSETLESGRVEEGSNLLLGSYKHNKTHERTKT
ncbi:MAG: hypothetical protein ABSH53_01435 [Holophaga sp.]|jgi:hypothetical protein